MSIRQSSTITFENIKLQTPRDRFCSQLGTESQKVEKNAEQTHRVDTEHGPFSSPDQTQTFKSVMS